LVFFVIASEAKQSSLRDAFWIASSLTLLAMTTLQPHFASARFGGEAGHDLISVS
jgi:hypothetical protein